MIGLRSQSSASKGPVPIRRLAIPANEDVFELPVRGTGGATGDTEFLPSALQILDRPPSPYRWMTVSAVTVLMMTILAWSYFGRLSDYTSAPGKIEAVGRTQIIEPRERGQIKSITVSNGTRVTQGDALIELDPTAALANQSILEEKIANLRAENARRQIEMTAARAAHIDVNSKIDWEDSVPQALREREQSVLHANLSQLAATLAQLESQKKAQEIKRDGLSSDVDAQKSLTATDSDLVAMHEILEKRGWDSEANLLTVQTSLRREQSALAGYQTSLADAAAAIPVIDSEISKTRENFITDNTEQVASAELQLDQLAEQLTKAAQSVTNMTLRAPVSGTIEASAITTIGQVVNPGQQLLQLVPDGAYLKVQAYVPNSDIGFLKEGQHAEIKVNSFPYGVYGSISATITQIASQALPSNAKNSLQTDSLDENVSQTSAAQDTDSMIFPITVVPRSLTMTVDGKDIPLTSGMSVTVDIKTEDRRAIDYIISPLLAIFTTAAHERS
jgi:hemolysin D